MTANSARSYNESYTGSHLDRIAFPLGGIGAGMVALSGTGALCQVSLDGSADVHNEPYSMSALYVKGEREDARVLEGPVPDRKLTFPYGPVHFGSGNSGPPKTYGLPRFSNARFTVRFPFANIVLSDESMPVDVHMTAWSPFVLGDEDACSLPSTGIEYTIRNKTDQTLRVV